jgi:ribosome-associated translation inhibitor RaiA
LHFLLEADEATFKTQLERAMQIQINTDHNIQGQQALSDHFSGVVKGMLGHFSEHITRVEVHLSDVNGHKVTKDDKHCLIEARLEGRQPIVASHSAETLHQAVDRAAEKLARAIDGKLGRIQDQKTRFIAPALANAALDED